MRLQVAGAEGNIMAAESNATPLESRFFTASAGNPPTEEQKSATAQIREATVQLAAHIEALVPGGRNKSLALTHLEDVLMRANRGIYADADNR